MTTRSDAIYKPDAALDRDDYVALPLVRGRRLTTYLLRVLSGTGGVVAGGYARWAASPRRDPGLPGDVDVFCRDEATYARVRAHLESFGHAFVRENRVSVVYAARSPWFGPACPPVNVVKPMRQGAVATNGDLHEVLHNFDMTVCKVGILDARTALAHFAFRGDEQHRCLRFTRIHTPVTGILRAVKYAGKGYRISLREALRLLQRWDAEGRKFKTAARRIVHARSVVRPGIRLTLTREDELRAPTLPSFAEPEPLDVDVDATDALAEAYSAMFLGWRS